MKILNLPSIYKKQATRENIQMYLDLANHARGRKVTYKGRIWTVDGPVWLRPALNGNGRVAMSWPCEVSQRLRAGDTSELAEAEHQLKKLAEEPEEQLTVWEWLQTPEGKKAKEGNERFRAWVKRAELKEALQQDGRAIITKGKLPDISGIMDSQQKESSNTKKEKAGTWFQAGEILDAEFKPKPKEEPESPF